MEITNEKLMWDCPLFIERVFFCLLNGAGVRCYGHSGGGGGTAKCMSLFSMLGCTHLLSNQTKDFNDTKGKIPTYGTIGLGYCSDESCLGVK